MNNKIIKLIICVIIIFSITGCGKSSFESFDLPESSVELFEINNTNNEEKTYYAVKHNDRFYLFYGPQKKNIKKKNIKNCIGYKDKEKNDRFYSLNDTDDFIVEYNINEKKEQVSFYRAIDTKDKNIKIPDYVDNFSYDYWK